MSPECIEWCDEYKTGNAQVDRQRQQLFQIVNKLDDLIAKEYTIDLLKDTLDQLIQYSQAYFATEESLMLSDEYVGYEEHQKNHQQLNTKLRELRENLETKHSSINVEISNFLNQRLVNHLKEEDLKMIKFFPEKEAPSIVEPSKLRRTKLAINSYYTRNMLNRQKKS